MCIPAIKGVEVGGGVGLAGMPGIDVHDEVFPGGNPAELFLGKFLLPFHRDTNRAGGLEGGMTNGGPVVVRAAMKPIPTQSVPLRTVTIDRYVASTAHRERSDVCAVPAASVVAEAMVALVLADAFLEKFGGDAMRDILYNYSGYLRRICGE
jgi:chorismate synthase